MTRIIAAADGSLTLKGFTAGAEYEVTATEVKPAPEGSVLWYGSFESGNIDKTLFPYSNFVAGHVTVVPDPAGSGQKVLRFAIPDSDRPYSGATAPRGDVESPPFFHPGNEVFVGTQTLLPIGSGFPTSAGGWFQVSEIYGKPYGGSPTIGQDLIHDSAGWHYCLQRDATHGYDKPWVGPVLDGKWHQVIFHVRFATNNTGFVEVYYDGVLQKFSNGSTRLYYITLQKGIDWDGTDGNFLNTNSYRQAEAYPGTDAVSRCSGGRYVACGREKQAESPMMRVNS